MYKDIGERRNKTTTKLQTHIEAVSNRPARYNILLPQKVREVYSRDKGIDSEARSEA